MSTQNILQNGYSTTLVISMTISNFSNKEQHWAQANQFSLTVTFSTLTLSDQEKIDKERTVSMIPVLMVVYAHILLEIGKY